MNARLLLILLIIVSEGVIAQDYSLTGLNKTMNQLMQPIDQRQQQWQATQFKCANGDDSACITVGIDPGDPCRSYVANYQERDICRIQQCAAGNQDECRKSQEQSKKMQSARDDLNNARSHNAKMSCESQCYRMKSACGRYCDDYLCRSTCEVEYKDCKARC